MIKERKFHLKTFSLHHHRSTMKAGTDSSILSAWVNLDSVQSVLDIGTGCGILSLFIASRCSAEIDAVELDKNSAIEAMENFSLSPFHRRMKVINSDFNEFAKDNDKKYDLLISNPPFFINDLRPLNEQKKTARHTDSLTYGQLCLAASKLLNTSGRITVVLPYDESRLFLEVAQNKNLHLQNQLIIFPKRGHQPNRVNLQLGFKKPGQITTGKFIIREDDGSFSRQYIDLLKAYYIGLA